MFDPTFFFRYSVVYGDGSAAGVSSSLPSFLCTWTCAWCPLLVSSIVAWLKQNWSLLMELHFGVWDLVSDYFSTCICSLVENSPRGVSDCRDPSIGFEELLNQRVQDLRGREESLVNYCFICFFVPLLCSSLLHSCSDLMLKSTLNQNGPYLLFPGLIFLWFVGACPSKDNPSSKLTCFASEVTFLLSSCHLGHTCRYEQHGWEK